MRKYGLRSRLQAIADAMAPGGDKRRSEDRIAVLMVCTANICRSPMAEGIMQQRLNSQGWADALSVESAGVYVFQPGRKADARARKICRDRGVNIRQSRARQINNEDFSRCDHILAMDQANFQALGAMCPEQYRHKLSLATDFAPEFGITEIPDPYFSNTAGFERVFEILEVAVDEFLRRVDVGGG